MVTLLAIAAMSPAAMTAPVENVKLVRSYKSGETQTYSLHVEMEANGASMGIDAQILFKIGKTTDEGATATLSVRDYKMKHDGADTGSAAPEEMESPLDRLGMLHVMSVENEAWVYILAALAGFVPGKETEVGSGFDIKWESKDKVFAVGGKGKLLEIVEHEGVKAAKLDYDLEVKPGTQSPGQVKCKTLVAIDGVSPLMSEGSVTVDGGTIKFTVKKLKG